MAVIIEADDGREIARHPRGMLIRRGLSDGEVAISVAPSGRFDDPAEQELARGRPTFFVNRWGVRVGRVGGITFWEEIEDRSEVFGEPLIETIQSSSRVTTWVTVHS